MEWVLKYPVYPYFVTQYVESVLASWDRWESLQFTLYQPIEVLSHSRHKAIELDGRRAPN